MEPSPQEPSPQEPPSTASDTGKSRGWRLLTVLVIPLLFALYPVVSLFEINQWEVPLRDLWRPVAAIVGLTIVLGLVSFGVARDRDSRRAAVAVSLFLLLLFNQGVAHAYFLQPVYNFLAIFSYGALYIVWNVVSFLAILWILQTRRPSGNLLPTAAVVGLVLVVPSLFRMVWKGMNHRGAVSPVADATPVSNPTAPSGAVPQTSLPDLYCIVVDGYGRQDVLQRMYGVDNEPFLRELEQRGFYVARHARANYIQTMLALTSALNLDYLKPPNPNEMAITVLDRDLDKNRIAKTLRARGFQIIYIATGFPLNGANFPDKMISPNPPLKEIFTPIERLIIEKTPFGPLLVNERAAFDKHRLQLLESFNEAANAAKRPEPKFVLAHILAPHPPFVFGPNGESVYPERGIFKIGDATDYIRTSSGEKYKQGYADQARYINTRILATVDTIQKESTRPAVIVVMGDHGPRSETDWGSLEKTNLREPFYNLLAVATTGGKGDSLRAALTDEITPINVFRLIFTHVYGENLPRLPDNSHYSTLTYPFRFTDVTASVKGREAGAPVQKARK
jgi:hypothetical protein